jgi:myo-inositol 2-dehydrogenase / D-chiro-inositol 1-dehydrogenase
LIGCGRIAERGYVPALARAQGVLLTAVADPVPERCAQAAPGVPSLTTAAELIDARVADALVLATPVATHLPDARLAAEAGLHVLIEKPPARTAQQAAELAALDPFPWIGFNRRFEPDVRKLRDAARAASRVELSLVLRTRRTSWRAYEVDDVVLLNLGPHAVDLALWITWAQPERVDGQVRRNRAVLVIDLGNRGVARIECAGNRPYRERIDVRSGDRCLARYDRGGVGQAFARSCGRLGGPQARWCPRCRISSSGSRARCRGPRSPISHCGGRRAREGRARCGAFARRNRVTSRRARDLPVRRGQRALLQGLADEGRLPTLAGLRSRGRAGSQSSSVNRTI